MKKKKVVIIGGGLAGLSAAHYLLHYQKDLFDVTIIEARDRLGGRIYTPNVYGVPVDVGGFMIFPFYKELRSLLKEFGLDEQLRSISDKEFYQFPKTGWVNNSSISIFKKIPVKLIPKIIKGLMAGRRNYYDPNLDLFDGISAYELMVSVGVDEQSLNIFEMILGAYTYPSLKKFPAAIFTPIALKFLFGGMFNRCEVIDGGTSMLVDAMTKEIKDNSGKIILSCTAKEIKNSKVILENGESVEFDNLIVASQPLFSGIQNMKIEDNLSYTHYDFVVAKLSKAVYPNGVKKWFIGYRLPNGKELGKEFFTSFSQMSSFTDLSDEYIGGWLKWPESETVGDIDSTKDISKKMIEDAFKTKVEEICHIHRWGVTMPNISIETIRKFKEAQGKNNIWYAGDFLGAPCMDMAVYTGKKAAIKIVEKYCN